MNSINLLENIDTIEAFRINLNNLALTLNHTTTLRSLEEFHVECSNHINDIEAMAGKLDKLKPMHMREADVNSILPSIRHAKRNEENLYRPSSWA